MKGGGGDYDVCHYGYDFCNCECDECIAALKLEDENNLRLKVNELIAYRPELILYILKNTKLDDVRLKKDK